MLRGEVRLDAREDRFVDRSREPNPDELVARRVALGEHRDAAAKLGHTCVLKLASDGGTQPSFRSIDARCEIG
jgi:hypothetical protein